MSSKGDGSAYQFDAIEKVKKLRQVDGKMQNYIAFLFSALRMHINYDSVNQHSHDVSFFK